MLPKHLHMIRSIVMNGEVLLNQTQDCQEFTLLQSTLLLGGAGSNRINGKFIFVQNNIIRGRIMCKCFGSIRVLET